MRAASIFLDQQIVIQMSASTSLWARIDRQKSIDHVQRSGWRQFDLRCFAPANSNPLLEIRPRGAVIHSPLRHPQVLLYHPDFGPLRRRAIIDALFCHFASLVNQG